MIPYEVIKDGIIIGELEPGSRITEEGLAKKLNVSRTPIREAIKQLESDGLVTPLKRRGVIVTEFTEKDIVQIYNLRALLESFGANEAALNRTEEELVQMEISNHAYEEAIMNLKDSDINSIKRIQQTNQKFHEEIYNSTKNNHLKSLISKVVVLPLVFRSFYWYEERHLLRSLEVHKTILEAIKSQEPDRAKVAMQEHIYQGRDDVLKYIKKNRFWREKEYDKHL